jgi:hypothetical protein
MENTSESITNPFAGLIFDKEFSSKVDWTLLFARFNYNLPRNKEILNLNRFKAFFSIYLITLQQQALSQEPSFENVLNKTLYSFNYKQDWCQFAGLQDGYHLDFPIKLFTETNENFERTSDFQVLFDFLFFDKNSSKESTESNRKANRPSKSAFIPIQATECFII